MQLLFDLDGTLSDPGVGITRCIQHALSELGQDPPPAEALLRYIGPPLQDAFIELLGSRHAAVRAIEHYRERFTRLGMFENRLYDGIEASLQVLGQSCERMYVVTSKPRVFAEKIVTHFSLQHHFRKVYGSDLDGKLSGKADLIAWVLSAEAIAADTTVMIGDRSHDMIGATTNGVSAIGVLWGYGSEEELVTGGAQRLCERPELLVSCIAEHCRQ